MAKTTQRTSTRSRRNAPIRYSTDGKGQFKSGKMLNISAGGLCFESDRPISPGTGVNIRFENCVSDPYWPESCNTYYAEVRWCSERMGGHDENYCVGVRFLMEKCRRCGADIPHQKEHYTGLCGDCFSHIRTISNLVVYADAENQVMGRI